MKINKNVSGCILTSAKIDCNGNCHYGRHSLIVKLNKVHRETSLLYVVKLMFGIKRACLSTDRNYKNDDFSSRLTFKWTSMWNNNNNVSKRHHVMCNSIFREDVDSRNFKNSVALHTTTTKQENKFSVMTLQ